MLAKSIRHPILDAIVEKELAAMINAKEIRNRVLYELFMRLGSEWLERKGKKRFLSSAGNATDFVIEIECQADRRHNDYECYLVAVLHWKKFSTIFNEFDKWYKGGGENSKKKSTREFMRVSFLSISGDFVRDKQPAVVINDYDIDFLIEKSEADFRGKVGRWLRVWFNWPSALNAMDENGLLCGSWRNIAYYCLLEEVKGRDVACKWINKIEYDSLPQFQSSQIKYLRSILCN